MASKATVKRLNQELLDKRNNLDYLKNAEPEEYLKEKDGLEEEIRVLKLKLFQIIVEDYPKQNPVKWVDKKDRLLAKLAFMEAGGLEENFRYGLNAPKAEEPKVETSTKSSDDQSSKVEQSRKKK